MDRDILKQCSQRKETGQTTKSLLGLEVEAGLVLGITKFQKTYETSCQWVDSDRSTLQNRQWELFGIL